jgi:hypothetical protein
MKRKRALRRLQPGQQQLKPVPRHESSVWVCCPACHERLAAASLSFHTLYDCSERRSQDVLASANSSTSSTWDRLPDETPGSADTARDACLAQTQAQQNSSDSAGCHRNTTGAAASSSSTASQPDVSTTNTSLQTAYQTLTANVPYTSSPHSEARNAFRLLMTPQRYLACYWTMQRFYRGNDATGANGTYLRSELLFAGDSRLERLLTEPCWRCLGSTRLADALWRPSNVREQYADASKIRTQVIWLAHKSLFEHDAYVPATKLLEGREPRLPRALLLSALQKSIRRARWPQVVRLSRYLIDRYGLGMVARRLLVITVEDSMAHPAMPILAWFMGTASKGYQPTAADVDAVLRFAAEISSVAVRDLQVSRRYHSIEAFQHDWAVCEEAFGTLVPAPARALVASLLLRALFGGMHGDQLMMREYAVEWLRRFLLDTQRDPLQLEIPAAPLAMLQDSMPSPKIPSVDQAWYAVADAAAATAPSWLQFLEKLYERVRSLLSSQQIRWEADQCVSITDIPPAAVGPFSGLPSPTSERVQRSRFWQRISRTLLDYAPKAAPEDTWASLIWHLRAKLNVRPCWSVVFDDNDEDDNSTFTVALQLADNACEQLQPFFTSAQQRVCWQNIAPQVEALSMMVLRRYFSEHQTRG